MTFSADKVIVELEAKVDRYNQNVNAAAANFDRRLSRMEGSARRTERVVTGAFRSMASAAGVSLGAAGLIAAARGFLAIADQAKNLEAQLRLATRESGNFATAQADVRRIAAETRSGLEATANLYSAFQRSARELGITQTDVARITQTVSESFRVSGATAADSAQATRQLVQAFQSGVLRGDEFNSMAENAPRLQRLLAQSLGVTAGALRAMAEDGELTAQKLATAFTDRRFTAGLDQEFRTLPVTFEQSMTLVENAAIQTFGAFDSGGEFSQSIANFFAQSASGFGDMTEDATNTGITIRATMEGLGDVFGPMLDGASNAFAAIRNMAAEAQADIRAIFGALDSAAAGLRRLTITTLAQGNPFLAAQYDQQLPGATPVVPTFDRGVSAAQRRLRVNADARRRGLVTRGGRDMPGNEFQRYLNEPGRYDIFGREIHPPRAHPAAPTGGHKGRHPRSTADADARREAAETGRFTQELLQLQTDLIAARQAQVTAAEAIAAYEVQQIEAERDRQNQHYTDQAEQTRGDKEVARARARQLIEANNAVAAERIRAVGLREQDRLAQERLDVAKAAIDNDQDLEQAQGQLADTTAARRDSALRLLDLQQQQERLELEAIVASRTSTQAQKDIAQARLDILDTLYQARRQGVMNENLSPRERYIRDLEHAAANVNEQLEQIEISGVEGLAGDFARATREALGLEGTLGNVVEQLVLMVLQTQILLPLMRSMQEGGGGIGGFFSSIFGGGSAAIGSQSNSSISSLLGLIPGHAIGGHVQAGRPIMVGERGPEPFIPGRSGSIIPNNRMASLSGSGGAGIARVQIELSGDIDGRIASVSGPVAVEIVRAAAPQIVNAAKAETLNAAMRRRLNG